MKYDFERKYIKLITSTNLVLRVLHLDAMYRRLKISAFHSNTRKAYFGLTINNYIIQEYLKILKSFKWWILNLSNVLLNNDHFVNEISNSGERHRKYVFKCFAISPKQHLWITRDYIRILAEFCSQPISIYTCILNVNKNEYKEARL